VPPQHLVPYAQRVMRELGPVALIVTTTNKPSNVTC